MVNHHHPGLRGDSALRRTITPPLLTSLLHVITDPIYPYPYRVVITTLVAEQLDTYPDL